MSTPLLIEVLKKMLKINQSLYEITVNKTVVIKNGDIEALQSIIRDEQKHIAGLQLLEQQRHEAVRQIQTELTINSDNLSISDLLNYIHGPNRDEIQMLQGDLTALISEIGSRNELNQELLILSLQFVNLNLDLLMPSSELSNYTLPSKEDDVPTARPIFDSQA